MMVPSSIGLSGKFVFSVTVFSLCSSYIILYNVFFSSSSLFLSVLFGCDFSVIFQVDWIHGLFESRQLIVKRLINKYLSCKQLDMFL